MALSSGLTNQQTALVWAFLRHLKLSVPPLSMVEPGEPRHYPPEEIEKLTNDLTKIPIPGFVNHSDPNRPDPPFVRPVNHKLEFLIDDSNPRLNQKEKHELHNLELVKWINDRYTGRKWPTLYPQKRPIVQHQLGNHALWTLVNFILLDWFWHIQDSFQFSDPYHCMSELIFRSPSDFYSGSWREALPIWLILMNRMPETYKDEVYESIRGVDLWSHTRRVFRSNPINHRDKRDLYTVPVSNADYTARCLGRRTQKRKLGPKSIIGYRTLVKAPQGRDDKILHLKTPRVHLEYSGTISKQLKKWISNGAVVPLGRKSNLGSWKERIFHINPLSVEPKKPRICVNGEAQRYTAPRKKLSCILDTVQSILNAIRPNDWLTKLDDKSGFLHLIIDDYSQKLAAFEFNDLIFLCRGLCFGLTQSPPKFQDCNRVVQILLASLGHRIGLYLDDRGSMEAPNSHKPTGFQTTHGCYFMLILLTALGGFLSIDKSSVIPSKRMEFLGFGLGKIFKLK